MKKYQILFKPEAKTDMDTLYFYIALIYNVESEIVIIRRIISSAMIF